MKKVVTVGDTDSAPYIEALHKAGVELVEGNHLLGFDGLVLMGGADVNPARYGEPRDPKTDEPDDVRDELECSLIEEALVRDLPILESAGVCRF